MSVNERDPHTGHMLTGHEWNGIKELNTPVPKPVWIFLTAAFLFSVACWILLPAWPLGSTYTKGLLGTDQRNVVTEQVHNAAMARSV
jgi:cytochrome c oxidase cbb3-type subunit 3